MQAPIRAPQSLEAAGGLATVPRAGCSSGKTIGRRRRLRSGGGCLEVLLLLAVAAPLHGAGLYRDGMGARAMSLAGADAAGAATPLAAMTLNPAGLSAIPERRIEFGAAAGLGRGEFWNSANSGGGLDVARFWPEAALAWPVAAGRWTLGLSSVPEIAGDADWVYLDAPGGLGGTVSYGKSRHRARIVVLRSALGAGFELSPRWHVGGSVGLLYNANKLQTPYTFQTQPALAGAKTLLDLETDGFGVDGHAGLVFRAADDWSFGLSYRTGSSIRTRGDAQGDAGTQFGVDTLPFDYQAAIRNRFPRIATAGMAWQAVSCWRLSLQLDWLDWSDAFRQLEVRLTEGTSVAINALTGGTSLDDDIPLRWRDQWVVRFGSELALNPEWRIRAGYSHARSPVPEATLTPMTAAITEHAIAMGLGWQRGRCAIDAGYQLGVPSRRSVGSTAILSGEYANSRIETTVHLFALTLSVGF